MNRVQESVMIVSMLVSLHLAKKIKFDSLIFYLLPFIDSP
jgi:hypothetical protein